LSKLVKKLKNLVANLRNTVAKISDFVNEGVEGVVAFAKTFVATPAFA